MTREDVRKLALGDRTPASPSSAEVDENFRGSTSSVLALILEERLDGPFGGYCLHYNSIGMVLLPFVWRIMCEARLLGACSR